MPAGRENPDSEADNSYRDTRNQRPRLWLVSEAARSDGEQDEARAQSYQRRTGHLVVWPTGEGDDHKEQAKQKTGHDGSEDDEPDVSLR